MNTSPKVTLLEAFWVWVKVGLLSFGGPAGQIAVMHRILVEEKKWISENRFLHALNYCMLLPGPEAQQLATYTGWLLHGTKGGLIAGILFVLPGFVSILVLSLLYSMYQETGMVMGLFFGLKAAVLAIVFEALIRISKRALKNRVMYFLSAAAFAAIFFFQVPFPYIVICAALTGWIGGKFYPAWFHIVKGQSDNTNNDKASETVIADTDEHTIQPTLMRTIRVAVVWLLVWWVPVLMLVWVFGTDHVFTQEAIFFSKTAVVTFGGAYTVLAYIAQQAVDVFGWLQPGEMLDGLGMAETTPGPLIQVVQFVGYMGAFRFAPEFHPVISGIMGSIITTWVTFMPCFLWIFMGAPYIEYLRNNSSLSMALSAVTASVVGVILNLSIWMALHTLFASVDEYDAWGMRLLIPDFATLNSASLALTVMAFFSLLYFHIGMVNTIIICSGLGLMYQFLM